MTLDVLNGIIKADVAAKCKMKEIEQLKTLRGRVTACLKDDVVQTSGADDKLGDLTAAIVDLENELRDCIAQGILCRREFEDTLTKITSPQEYEVMHRRYVQFQSFGRIAKEMHFSKSAVVKIHERILKKVYDCPQSVR